MLGMRDRGIFVNYDIEQKINDEVCCFKKMVERTNDLLLDSYQFKLLAESCGTGKEKDAYSNASNKLYEVFLSCHNLIGEKFKGK